MASPKNEDDYGIHDKNLPIALTNSTKHRRARRHNIKCLPIDEEVSIGKHFRHKHSLAPEDLTKNLSVLMKCTNKFDCLVQSRKGTKSAVKPTRKGRTSAEKVQINRLERNSQTHKARQKMARREKCLGEQPTTIHLR